MSINNGDPERRWAGFTELVLTDPPDILLIQEVSADIGHSALRGLTQSLGPDYDMRYEPVYPNQTDTQGVAVISNLPIKKAEHAVCPPEAYKYS
jgi:endonuclease/exonuclease/phosphatase family metal-dependent hydrolase